MSIVIAVYNKAAYLDRMFKSVSEQVYKNIEVIIVNDGSTDGSKRIISKWQQEFILKGFEAVVVDQENSGVAAAIKTGLSLASGEYVCFPDADDELMPDYVSAMVETINNGYDYVICDIGVRKKVDGGIEATYQRITESENQQLLERYLLNDMANTLYMFLVKLQYLKNIGLIKTMITDSRISQEPQLIIPMLFYSNNAAFIHKMLYVYNTYAQALGKTHIDNPMSKVLVEYHNVQVKVIDSLDTSDDEKKRLESLSKLGNIFHAHSLLDDKSRIYKKAAETLIAILPDCKSLFESVSHSGIDILQAAACIRLLNRQRKSFQIKGKVIAFGSLGEIAARLLPHMKGTPLWPTVFFDKSAKESSALFDGTPVFPTDEALLDKDDVLLCLPKILSVEQHANELAEKNDATALNYFDIIDYLADWYYPELSKG